MAQFVDLHCHWVCKIDDGARSPEESLAMLRALSQAGFSHVVGTPHMRPGMFNNSTTNLRNAYAKTRQALQGHKGLPETSLASEHFFDSDILATMMTGQALPYRNDQAQESANALRMGGAILIEFEDMAPQEIVRSQLHRLQQAGYIPVIAHPERYRTVWKKPEFLESLIERGAVALLDSGAVVGKYGANAQKCAEELMERGLYDAACTDSHRESDVHEAMAGIEWIEQHYGPDEVHHLLVTAPQALLTGKAPPS